MGGQTPSKASCGTLVVNEKHVAVDVVWHAEGRKQLTTSPEMSLLTEWITSLCTMLRVIILSGLWDLESVLHSEVWESILVEDGRGILVLGFGVFIQTRCFSLPPPPRSSQSAFVFRSVLAEEKFSTDANVECSLSAWFSRFNYKRPCSFSLHLHTDIADSYRHCWFS